MSITAISVMINEHIPLLPKCQRTTNRLWLYILDCLKNTSHMKDIACGYNLSPTSIARIIDEVYYRITTLPEVISIDEFKGDAGKKS